jgi:uncharacterized protein
MRRQKPQKKARPASTLQSHNFHVQGMHCSACVLLTESELKDHDLVETALADLKTCCVEVRGRFGGRSKAEVAAALTKVLEPHGYTLATEASPKRVRWSDFRIALPIAVGFMVLFVVLQKLGLVNLIAGDEVTYGTAFLIGSVASVSTCMAVVGSLVLSVSANYAKEGDKIRPQALFHIGRLISFFILGGAIGALGSTFQLGVTGAFLLSLIVAVVLLILGINLLDVFPWAKKLQPTLPRFLSSRMLEAKKLNHTLTPFLLGAVTFFLPCGFTQAMQIQTLATGSFLTGATTMLVFALGTLPVLALLSFGSLGLKDKVSSGIFFKTAGLVVIFFALFNFVNSLAIIQLIPPVFNF